MNDFIYKPWFIYKMLYDGDGDLKNKTKKKRVYFRPLMSSRVYINRFLILRNRTGMVAPHAFHSRLILAFDQSQLDAYCAAVWRWFEVTFKVQQVIPIFERNEMTECPRKPRQPTSVGITGYIQSFSTQ